MSASSGLVTQPVRIKRVAVDNKLTKTSKSNSTDLASSSSSESSDKRLINIRLNILRWPTVLCRTTKISRQPPPEPTLVHEKFIYLGGLKSLNNKTRLSRLNITHILSVVYIPPSKATISLNKNTNFKHLFLKADDSIDFNMTVHFEPAFAFIEEARLANKSVLCHCVCGISRSTTIVCAYLMKYNSMSLENALLQIKSKRSIIQPNIGFLKQLVEFDEQLKKDREQSINNGRGIENSTIENLAEQMTQVNFD
ncbi:unnamed protein product [Didymodactylos carnosus]|uniref:protein-tyrosine-phosphatase n=1 Tax=Didymodactylos carnosus TaxID=1234261 RepID=A0A813T7H9_9BILA|nr:unnamed protein product [Didymodactylos carnosus]CAF0812295.1 unnamed protein product [Didymodactylos carnosus]CAF3592997.1 unnamed protein product [Didymodactylos carnosus]CAF3596148.1 unnamed protein product [Didymodactylos carnosus]